MTIFIVVLAIFASLALATHLRQLAEASGLIEAHGAVTTTTTTTNGDLVVAEARRTVGLRLSSIRACSKEHAWVRELHRWAFAPGVSAADMVSSGDLSAAKGSLKAQAWATLKRHLLNLLRGVAAVGALALAVEAPDFIATVVGNTPLSSVPAHVLGLFFSLITIPLVMLNNHAKSSGLKYDLERKNFILIDEIDENRNTRGWVLSVQGTFRRQRITVRAPFDGDGAFIPRGMLDPEHSKQWGLSIEADFFDVKGYYTGSPGLSKAMSSIVTMLLVEEEQPFDEDLGRVMHHAWHAALRRNKKQDVLRLKYKAENDRFFVEKSRERAPARPLLEAFGDHMVMIHVSEDAAHQGKRAFNALQALVASGDTPIPQKWGFLAEKKGKLFFGHKGLVKVLHERFRSAKVCPAKAGQSLAYNAWEAGASVALRIGTLLGRKAGWSYQFDLSDLPLLPEALDGTIAVTSKALDVPLQGTLKGGSKAVWHLMKGVIRRPVVLNGRHEAEGISCEEEMGFATDRSQYEDCVMQAFDVPAEQTSSTNQQLVAFSASDQGENWYSVQTDAIDPNDPTTVASQEEMEWIEIGVPEEFAFDGHSVRDRVRKDNLGDHGYRAMVYGVGTTAQGDELLGEEEIALPEHIAERFGVEVGDVIRVGRDPGATDGSSIREYRFVGSFELKGSDFSEGIVLNARSTKWLTAGGDFDGDTAVVWPKGAGNIGDLVAEQGDGIVDARSARENASPVGWSRERGDWNLLRGFLTNATRGAWAQRSDFSIGAAINSVSRLWATDGLNTSYRANGKTLGQGAIDALKHAVDYALMQDAQTSLYNAKDVAYDETRLPECCLVDYGETNADGSTKWQAPDLITAMGVLKRAGGDNATSKDEAWELLVETCTKALAAEVYVQNGENKPFLSDAAKAFARYVLKLAETRQAYQEAMESTGVTLVDALSSVLGEYDIQGLDKMDNLVYQWKQAVRRKIEAKQRGASKRHVRFLSDLADQYLVRIRSLHSVGRVSTGAILAVIDSGRLLKGLLRPSQLEDVMGGEEVDMLDLEDLEL